MILRPMLVKNSSSMMLSYHLPLHTKHLDHDNDDDDNDNDDDDDDDDENVCDEKPGLYPKRLKGHIGSQRLSSPRGL